MSLGWCSMCVGIIGFSVCCSVYLVVVWVILVFVGNWEVIVKIFGFRNGICSFRELVIVILLVLIRMLLCS